MGRFEEDDDDIGQMEAEHEKTLDEAAALGVKPAEAPEEPDGKYEESKDLPVLDDPCANKIDERTLSIQELTAEVHELTEELKRQRHKRRGIKAKK